MRNTNDNSGNRSVTTKFNNKKNYDRKYSARGKAKRVKAITKINPKNKLNN